MTLLETDLIFAYLNEKDKFHEASIRVFDKINKGSKLSVSILSLVELELIYKSSGYQDQIQSHLAILSSLQNIEYSPLSVDIVLTSIVLREEHGLSFFDSHYAATAIHGDGKILSTDQAYTRVPGLTLIEPDQYQ
ncbi:PIN domain-containing protein [Candidatus Bathyarchaeota archaeon]|nr:PIN domain-containing protein [Candidatus Bathyarchaeota archaeon]